MNDDEKRITIAEACGAKWQDVPQKLGHLYHPKRLLSFHDWDFNHPRCAPLPFPDPDTGDAVDIPDYINDLNAMHEAEKSALTTPELRGGYRHHLEAITGNAWCIFATAAQRAEAFLMTIKNPAPKL